MTVLNISLGILLLLSLLWLVSRERHWQGRLRELARATGLTGQQANRLQARLAELHEASKDSAKEEYLRRLFESLLHEIRQGVVIVDDQLRIKFSNRTMAGLFHKNSVQRGKTLIEEFQDHLVSDTVAEALSQQRRCIQNIEVTSSHGAEGIISRHYQIEAAPLHARAERGAWLMVHDITEQTMTEQIRKDFVANASHELRTPLTLINGYIETLQSGVINEPSILKRSLDIMEKHGKRILRIIEDMLTISRLEKGGATLNMEPFTVRACVQDALDHLTPMIEATKPQITFDFPADGGPMVGDRFYWDQVFTNLLENSLKENTNPGLEIKISGHWFTDHCLLQVSDNGIGIAAHDLPFVFKRFYRGPKHHSPQIKGTGLGLSIVRRAVEAHGGTIDLTSTPGIRTTFTMRVPLNTQKESVEVAASGAANPSSAEESLAA